MISRINPSAKLLANLIALIGCMLVFDPVTPLIFLIVVLTIGSLDGVFKLKEIPKFIPFLLFALGMVWMNAAWADVPDSNVIGEFGFFTFTDKGLSLGISLGLRILAIAAFSILFTSSTDPTDLVLSLVQQCRLSPSIAYSILAAIRLFPTLETELSTIQAAHRIRGKGEKGLNKKIKRWYRYAIPLLAGGIRKAERVALAMEARGFSSQVSRTYYKVITWDKKDTVFVIATLFFVLLSMYVSYSLGYKIGITKWQGF